MTNATAIDDFDTMFQDDPTEEPAQGETTALTPVTVKSQPQVMSPDDLPDLDEMQEGFSLAAQYREFDTPGETVRAVLIGFTEMNGQNGTVPVAVFQNREGVFVNAGTNLVQQVQRLPLNTPVQITFVDKVKTGKGNYVKKFEVKLLKPTTTPPPLPNLTTVTGPGVHVPSKEKPNGAAFNIKGASWTKVVAFGIKHDWWTAKDGGPTAIKVLQQYGWTQYDDAALDNALDVLAVHYAQDAIAA